MTLCNGVLLQDMKISNPSHELQHLQMNAALIGMVCSISYLTVGEESGVSDHKVTTDHDEAGSGQID